MRSSETSGPLRCTERAAHAHVEAARPQSHSMCTIASEARRAMRRRYTAPAGPSQGWTAEAPWAA
ncbi:hypothetical protein JOB18_015220 [Solea senegalensis]|uniref:Uncharacterized protein n=1 Tax=Solea senegalensis TaxID=28829 RepID=A0AAV6QHP7_SOLSE|nr:hypothetical protein JOB18_015220 [Solea senegalensis]